MPINYLKALQVGSVERVQVWIITFILYIYMCVKINFYAVICENNEQKNKFIVKEAIKKCYRYTVQLWNT